MCDVDKDIMYVFEIFVRHLDALHPSCAALLATTLWCLMSDTPVMQCDAQNAGSQFKVMAFTGPPYVGVLQILVLCHPTGHLIRVPSVKMCVPGMCHLSQ